MEKEYGQNPKWRWDDLIISTKRNFFLDIDLSFTDFYYEEIIVPDYTKGRHYHTLRHVEYMIVHAMDFGGISLKNMCLLKWAIWFHDIVYDAQKSDNEKRSADMLVDFLRAIDMEEEDIEVAKWLILVTSHKGSPQTKLEEIICDLDLREFASDRQEKNAPEVRQEFSHLSDEEWKKGRIEFIESMLAKEYIYHTDLYRETLEATARHNLVNEKESISNE